MVLLLSPVHLLVEDVWLSEMKPTIIITHISDYFNYLKLSDNCIHHMLYSFKNSTHIPTQCLFIDYSSHNQKFVFS